MRMPKTAINIPQVKNLFCQTGVISTNLLALTIALSKDKAISKAANIPPIMRNPINPDKVPVVTQRPDRTSVFAQYTVFVEHREQLQEKLKAVGIPTAVHYPIPVNEQPAYRHLCCPDCTPISKQRASQVMSLPMSADLTAHDQDEIFRVLTGAIA